MTGRIKRRLLLVLLILAIGGVIVARNALDTGQFQRDVAEGHLMMSKLDYRAAARAYVRALARDPQNADLLVAYGDALHHFPRFDPAYKGADRMAWERALVAAPDHLPAALRLLDWWRDEVTRAPSSAAYVEFAQAASRVLRRLPDHETAKIMSCVASIGLWLQEGGPVTPPVDSSAQELRRRADDGGIDPLAVWLLVQWNVRMSRTSSAAGDVKGETAAYLEEAAKVMETQLSRVPTNENLQSVAAQTWELLATTDPHNPIWLQRHRDAGSIARK